MKKLIRETAEEILQEYTSCYSEADEDCLVKMLEKLASNMAREIFEDIEKGLSEDEQDFERLAKLYQDEAPDYARIYVADLRERFAELRKKYESEGVE